MMRLLAVILLLMTPFVKAGQALVEAELQQVSVHPGQSATLRITVLVPTWVRGPPEFPAFEIPNLMARLPPDSSFPLSRNLGGETWSGIVRDYELTPLVPGRFVISGRTIRLRYAEPGKTEPVAETAVVPDIVLQASVPAGAGQLDPYLAATALTFSREVVGDTAALAAGDAVKVVTRMTVTGVPALFIPPLTGDLPLADNMVRIYRDEPVLDMAAGSRTETVTLVFVAGGSTSLPAITFDWWDLENETVASAAVPALDFEVAGAAPGAPAAAVGRDPVRGLALLVAVIVALLAFITWSRWRGKESAPVPEAVAWERLHQSLRMQQPAAVYRNLLTYLHLRVPGQDVRATCADLDPLLVRDFDRLSRAVYGDSGEVVEFAQLRQRLRATREVTAPDSRQLPALN